MRQSNASSSDASSMIEAPPQGEAAVTMLLVLMILSVSQALSPWAFLATLSMIGYLALHRLRLSKPFYTLFAAAMAINCAVGLALVPSTALASRVLILCALLALLAPMDFARFPGSLAKVSKFVRVSLLLCFVGFFYAAAGGPHLLTIDNPDGRQALLYLSTLSNSVFPAPGGGAIIRPSFIYDEPGAYAFVIDSVLLASYMVNKRLRREEWQLIVGGMLTFSLAHMLVTLLLLVAARKARYALLLLLLLVVVDYFIYVTIDYSLIFRRFEIADGALVGDNRSDLFAHALSLLHDFPEGVGHSCNWNLQDCFDRFGAFGENPAFPAAFYGWLPSLSYYVILATLAVASLARLRRTSLAVGLAVVALISQRPFLFNLGYNMLIIMLFSMYFQAFPLSMYRRKKCNPQAHQHP